MWVTPGSVPKVLSPVSGSHIEKSNLVRGSVVVENAYGIVIG